MRGVPGTNAPAQAGGRSPGFQQESTGHTGLPAIGPATAGPAAAGNGAPRQKPTLPSPPPPPSAPFPAPRPAAVPIEFAPPAPPRPRGVPKYAGRLIKMVCGFAGLILLGYFALIVLSPQARPWTTSKESSTSLKAINQNLPLPAQAIGKTKAVVVVTVANAPAAPAPAGAPAAAKSEEQAASGAPLSAMPEKLSRGPDSSGASNVKPGTSPVTKPMPVAPAPPKEPAAPAEVKRPGGIVISSASPVVRAAFFYWIVNLNISGVFQSPPHRIMLNNRLVYEGDELNAALGVTFDHLEPANKLIVFRDQTGALVTRSY